MLYNNVKPLHLFPYLLIITAVVIISSTAYLYFQHERQNAIKDKYENLSSIGSLKADFLTSWYKERITEAHFLSENSNFPSEIENYIITENYDRKHIISHLKHIIADGRYENIMFVNIKGEMFFSYLPNYSIAKSSYAEINNSIKTGEIKVADFYYCNEHKKVHFDIISPVKVEGRIIAALILRIDPNSHIFPALNEWPVQSNTSEVLLMKKSGENIQFLNELKKTNNSKLQKYYRPTGNDQRTLINLTNGNQLYIGKDYNGDEVIADVRKISGTNWIISVKTDAYELLAEFYKRALLIALVVFLIIVVFGIAIASGFIRRQKNIYKELLTHRSQLFKTQSELGTTLYAITDGILVTDELGLIKHMNPGAEKLTGWKEDEAIGKKLEAICSLISEDSRGPVEDLISKIIREQKATSPANHTLLVTKSGKEIPISQNGAPVINDDGTFTGVVIVINDRTEERQKNKLLKQSEERFYHLFERAPLAYQSLNDKGELIEVNQAWIDTFGFSREEAIGKWFGEFIIPSQIPLLKQNFRKFQDAGVIHAEFIMRHSDNDLRYVEIDGRIGYDKDGNFEKTHCIVQDVTEKKRMERELKENERHLSSLISHLPGFVYRCLPDETWTTLYISEGVEKITGFCADDFINNKVNFDFIIKSEFKDKIAILWKEAIDGHSFFEFEYKITTASNSERWIWERGKAVYDDNGDVLFLEGYIEDISVRRNNEMELRESEEKYRLLMDNSPDAILLTKPDGSTLAVNHATALMFGMDEAEVCARGRDGVIDPDDNRLSKLIEQRNTTGKVKGEVTFVKADGTKFPAEITSSIFKNSSGETMSSIIIRDMTLIKENERQLKQLNADLMAAKLKAEESDRLKTAFLANMSHEIRTPMNGILGFLELIREPDLNEETRAEYISFMNQSGQRLLSTINDIIEISKIESGGIETKMNEINLTKVFNYFNDFFTPQAREKNLELIFNTHIKDDAAFIQSDRYKLDGILTNLIKNAIKFTRKGCIEVGNYIKEDKLVIYVKDTGVGIPAAKLNSIFDRFVQADIHYSRDYEGSGLGLSIVKGYVDALNGTISCISAINEGSTFTVEIPYVKSRCRIIKTETSSPAPKILDIIMLIAEDDDISFRYMQDILKNTGIEIIRAVNGEQAVDLCKNNPDINIVLMDIKMAELDGYEATKLIRTFNTSIPIIAQTAYAFSEDREKALSVGCTDYLSKPVSRAKLITIIEKYLQVSGKETIVS